MDDDEARAILREHGEEPPARGRLGPQWKARAEDLRQGPAPAQESYDGGVSADDFVSEAAEPPAEVLPAERKPRKVRAARPSLRDRLKSSGSAKPKKRLPRVPVDRLISHAWDMMGGLAGRIDVPLGRCLQMQAPVAGLIMEDIVKGTFADRALQPIARAEEKAEKGIALVGPPLIVLGIEMAQQLPEEQMRTRMAILQPLLVESMVLWGKIAGDKMEDVIDRAKAEEPARRKAAELCEFIFGAAEPQKEPAAA